MNTLAYLRCLYGIVLTINTAAFLGVLGLSTTSIAASPNIVAKIVMGAHFTLVGLFIFGMIYFTILLKKTRPFAGPRGFWKTYFLVGLSWRRLINEKNVCEEIIKELQADSEGLLIDLDRYIQEHGLLGAREFIRETRWRKEREAHAAQEQVRRAARRDHRIDKVVAEGVAVGISEEEMRSLAEKGVTVAREAIEKKKQQKYLLERAEAMHCLHLVEPLIDDLYRATSMLMRCENLLARGVSFGIVETITNCLLQSNFDAAEQALGTAHKVTLHRSLAQKLSERVEKLEPHHQAPLRKLLQALEDTPFDTRQYHKRVYHIQRSLDDLEKTSKKVA